MEVKHVSLIIVCYNSISLIRDCLDSVFKFNDLGDELEVIIVDNQSNDQTDLFEIVTKEYPAGIQLIDAKSNSGYGAGNNLGVKHATARHFVVMNPDVRLVKPVFQEMLSAFEKHPDIAMASVSFTDKSCPFFYKPEYYTPLNLLKYKQKIKSEKFDSQKMHLPGSFLMFDKQAFLEAGGFDEKIFLYFEEVDIANRLEKIGRKVAWLKHLEVLHLAHNRKFNERLTRIELESLVYYIDKYKFQRRTVLHGYLWVFGMKYLMASFLGNRDKQIYFGGWVRLLKEKLNEAGN